MEIPASIAANAAMERQNMTMSVIKQNAQQGEAIAKILDNAVRTAPVNGARGANINILA